MRINCAAILLLSSISLLFTSCATLIHGSRQDVVVTSQPIHTNLMVDGFDRGHTPALVRLTRKDKHIIRIELPGYEPYETVLKRKFDGWIFGNLILGGIIGIAIDAASGSMYRLSTNDVYAELQKSSSVATSVKDGLYVNIVLKPKAGWQKIGTLTKQNTNSLRIKTDDKI